MHYEHICSSRYESKDLRLRGEMPEKAHSLAPLKHPEIGMECWESFAFMPPAHFIFYSQVSNEKQSSRAWRTRGNAVSESDA